MGLFSLLGDRMRKLTRTRIGMVMPNNDWIMDFGYILQVITFIGTSPVNRDYIMDGKMLMLFPTKGEALDYAAKEMNCGQVVFTTNKNEHCNIVAHITDSPFFNIKPLDYNICQF
jgi:hypothetical protein